MYNPEVFKSRLRELRGSTRQSEIAEKIGVSLQSYSAFENGREPGYSALVRLAEEYNVTTDFLLGISEKKQPDIDLLEEKTGLSADSIYALFSLKPLSPTLEMLLSHKRFQEFLENIQKYLASNIHTDMLWATEEERMKEILEGMHKALLDLKCTGLISDMSVDEMLSAIKGRAEELSRITPEDHLKTAIQIFEGIALDIRIELSEHVKKRRTKEGE